MSVAPPPGQSVLVQPPTIMQEWADAQKKYVELVAALAPRVAPKLEPWPGGYMSIEASCGCHRVARWPQGGAPITHIDSPCEGHRVVEWVEAGSLTTHSVFCNCEMVVRWPDGGALMQRAFFPCISHPGARGWPT